MSTYKIVHLKDIPEQKESFAKWFHEKWNIPQASYLESINESIDNPNGIPQWYGVMNHVEIIAGIGVIENDFHDRKDCTPNLCALYVEEEYRHQGIAKKLLAYVCDDMKQQGIDTLYLVTDHTSFYEKNGWQFLCMVQCVGESTMSRVYSIHTQ